MNPQAMILADLDGDGDLDVAVTNGGSGTVTLLLNRGNGTLATDGTYATGAAPAGIAAGDLDDDGDLDLLITSLAPTDSASQIYVLRNDGSAAFALAATYPAASGAGTVVAGDLNGDGALDVVVGTAGLQDGDLAHTGQLLLFLNAGDGTFSMTALASTVDASALALGDLNGDGALDILAVHQQLLLNDGQGNFPVPSPNGSGPTFDLPPLTAVDLNGDSWLDVVSANTVALSDGQGAFFRPVPYGENGASSVVGDVNGDGYPDLVLNNASGGRTVFLNDACGAFREGTSYSVGGTATTLADLNGDGKPDLVLLNDTGVTVVLNTTP